MEIATLRTHPSLDHRALDHGALRVIFEILPIGVLVTNVDRKSVFHNRAAREILETGDPTQGGTSEGMTVSGRYLSDQATPLSPEDLPVVRALRGEKISG
jgi:PAS domain-containing protein